MPLWDFQNQTSGGITTHHFWIFWATTIPLTTFVLVVYTMYLVYIKIKHQHEDMGAIAEKASAFRSLTTSRSEQDQRRANSSPVELDDRFS